jgi:glycosyltransferase involved in cell wall biosynthesis
MKTVPVSVAIPAYRSGPVLRQTLERICACDPLPQEILLHGDGGWRPEPELAESLPVPVRMFFSENRVGPGGGRHRLFQEAACEVVASFDDDSWPLDPDYFARAMAVMEAFPAAVVMSPAVYLKERPVLAILPEVALVRSFSGSASVTRRSLYVQLPGYVPVAEAYGVEETDLCLQAHAVGMQILSCPWLRAWHDRPSVDNQHTVLPWIRNEVLLAGLRFPVMMQPWGWVRALRHVWRHRHEVGLAAGVRAMLSALPAAVQLRVHRRHYSVVEVWRHHRHVEQRFQLHEQGMDARSPASDATSAGRCPRVAAIPAPPARRVLYLQYTNPGGYPPLEHSSRMLARAGWEVEFLGLAGSGAVTLEFAPHPRVRVRRMFFQPPGWLQKLHFLGFTAWCLWRVWRWRPDWIYASDVLSTPAAELIRRLFPSCRVLYHEHDSPIPGTVMDSGVAKKIWQARAALAHQADVVILPNEQRLQAFQAALRPRGACFCVWNCPSLDEVPQEPVRRPQDAPLRVLYHGSIVPDRFGPYVLEAAARCGRAVEVTLIGYLPSGHRHDLQALEEAALEYGIASRFAYLGPMSHHEVLVRSREHDVGLCLLRIHEADINMRHMVGASNKAFDYLSQGLAIVVPEDPEWRAFFVEADCALACPPHAADALADVFRWMADHRNEVAEMGRRGHRLVRERWHYEAQFAPVLKWMEKT